MERVVVSNPFIGFTYMQVCAVADASDEEMLEVANTENPSGTTGGWSQVARENYKEENMRPVTCEDNPTRKHFILIC